jgi:hypothetical protein
MPQAQLAQVVPPILRRTLSAALTSTAGQSSSASTSATCPFTAATQNGVSPACRRRSLAHRLAGDPTAGRH